MPPGPRSSHPSDRPTLLMVGEGEPMDRALVQALDRHGLFVESVGPSTLIIEAVQMTAPDAILLVGRAAKDGGEAVLKVLGSDASAKAVPVMVLASGTDLESRLSAFRHGAVAVVPRGASADAIATSVAELSRELSTHFERNTGELGEATFDELVDLVKKELRSGILSVHAPGHKGGPLRVVLGAGRPVADAVTEFVARLRPHVAPANPMYYQFHASAGGPVELLDMEADRGGDTAAYADLRVLLVDDDPARADALAQELRARGALVFVTDTEGRGLERAVGLDPQVAIVDAAGLEGQGFEVVRAIRKDPRLRWASILVAPWSDIWPPGAPAPDMAQLASRIEPLLAAERDLALRTAENEPFDTRLEATGPSRMLRTLVASGATLHVTVRSPKALVDVDVAQNLLVGATAALPDGETPEGTSALATLLSMSSGRAHVEPRENPAVANVMAPVDEALAVASAELPEAPSAGPVPSHPPGQAAAAPAAPHAMAVPRPGAPSARAAAASRGGWDDDAGPAVTMSPFGAGARTTAKGAPTRGKAAGLPARATTSAELDAAGDRAAKASPAPSAAKSTAPGPVARAMRAAMSPPPPPSTSSSTASSSKAAGPPRVPSRGLPGRPLRKTSPEDLPAVGGDFDLDAGTEVRDLEGLAKASRLLPEDDKPTMRPPEPVDASLSLPSEPPAATATSPVGATPAAPAAPRATTTATAPRRRRGTLVGMGGGIPAPPIPTATSPAAAPPDATAPSSSDAMPPIATSDALPRDAHATAPSSADAMPPPVTDATPPALPPRSSPVPTPPVMAGPPPAAPRSSPSRPRQPGEVTQRTIAAPRRSSAARTFAKLLVALSATVLLVVAALIAYRYSGVHEPNVDRLLAALGVPPLEAPREPVAVGTGEPRVPVETEADRPREPLSEREGVEAETGDPPPDPLPEGGGVEAETEAEAESEAESEAGTDPPPDPLPEGGGAEAASEAEAEAESEAESEAEAEAEAETEAEDPSVADATPEQLARMASRVPNPDYAERLYRRALALDAQEHHAMVGLGRLLMERGRHGEAVPLLQSAVRRRPRRAAYRVWLGDALRGAGDGAGAQREWREALELEPDNRQARQRLGR